MRPQHSDRFLLDYFPRPHKGASLASVCAAAPAGSGPQRSSCGATAELTPRCTQRHAGRVVPGARGTVVCPMQEPGLGYQPLLLSWPRRPTGLLGGLPHSPAPGRAGSPCAGPRGRLAGAAALSSLLGRAPSASTALPDSGPPVARQGATPPRVLGTRPSHALGPDASRSAKRQTPNRANRGYPGGPSHRTTGGGALDPLSPQPAGGAATRDRPPRLPPPVRGPWGHHREPGAGPLLILRSCGGLGGAGGAAGHPPPRPAKRLPPSLPDVFSPISAALSSRAPPRRRSPPRAR